MKLKKLIIFSTTLLTASAIGTSSAFADTSEAAAPASTTLVAEQPSSSASDLEIVAKGLRDGSAPRDIHTSGNIDYITYHLSGEGVEFDLTFPYHHDGSVAADLLKSYDPNEMVPYVGAGIDPAGPYIDLDSAEQGAGAVGAAGTIGAVICASSAFETAGIGCVVAAGVAATVVGIATAHGVCADGKTLRVYPGRPLAVCI